MVSFFNAVNCYCDASLTKEEDGTHTTCSGYILTYQNEIIESNTKIVSNSTNNYGEILAIYMGVDALVRVAGYDAFLNLFSDSKISIYGLKYWAYSWVRDMDKVARKLYNSSGQLVANQEIFGAIIGLICNANVHINLFHQRGHMNPNKVSDMNKMIKDFKADNSTEVSDDIIREITYYNDVIDNMTRETLLKVVNNDHGKYNKPLVVISNRLDMGMMANYKRLIG